MNLLTMSRPLTSDPAEPQHRLTLRLGPLDGPRPDPDLMLVRWFPEPDPDGPLGPCDRVGLHQLLNAVFLQDPGVYRMWGGRGCRS